MSLLHIRKNKKARMGKGGKRPHNNQIAPRVAPSTSLTKVETSFHHGPLPPPQVLEHYDQLVPGSAERIISMWEEQVRHRQGLERDALTSDIRQSYFGATLGFIIAMSAIGSGTFLAYIGRPTEGLAAIITAVVGLVSVYGMGSYQRRKERDLRIEQSLK
jgi:uncharacterized membrane protein